MGVYTIERKQLIKSDLKTVWEFFSSPQNLAKITPDYMQFKVTSSPEERIYSGQIITYKVSPILRIPLFWMTEISDVKEPLQFIDEQKEGPYKLWRHKHIFEQTDEGTLMTDKVVYELPLGPLGTLAHRLFVKKQLNGIFDFRQQIISRIFNAA
ncbi:MAG: SRPBCC family protein [Bacteroidetes bacterium]|nr:SRPBCC family protein [Bacteroidota bacterium]